MKRFDKGNRPGAINRDKNASPQRTRTSMATTVDGEKPKRFGAAPKFERVDAPKKPFAKKTNTPRAEGDSAERPYRAKPAYGDKPRTGGFEKKPYTPRTPRAEGDSAERPYRAKPAYGDKPRTGGFDKKPYTPRTPRAEGDSTERPYRAKPAYGDKPRTGGFEKKPYTPRAPRAEGDSAERPYRAKPAYGDKPRTGGYEKKPYTPRAPRAEGDSAERPYRAKPAYGDKPRTGGFEKKPYTPRAPRAEGDSAERPYRAKPAYGDKPRTGGFEKKPYTPRAPRTEGERWTPTAARPPKQALHDDWIWGTHATLAALNNAARGEPTRLVATDEAAKSLPETVTAEIIDREDLDRLLPRGASHQGLAVRFPPLLGVTIEEMAAETTGVLVVLDQVTDPQNVGAIFRSATAFGARGLILQDRHAPQMVGGLAKAAVGTIETLPYARVTNLSRALEQLRDSGWRIVGLAGEGDVPLAQALTDQPTVLVLGSEGEGLRRLVAEHCDVLAHIPMIGGTESLNVSATAAVALYAADQARQSAPSV